MTNNPTKLKPSDLSALMCARICHDLISPVGALAAALEVLDDETSSDMHADALDLVRLSARQTSAKLQFLRLAFGAGGSAPGVIGIDTLKTLVQGVYGEGKIELVWDTDLSGLDKNQARLLLNLVMMAAQTIPRGGTLKLTALEDNGVTLALSAKGLKARLDENLSRTLSGQAPEGGFEGRTIQSFYTGLIARELKGRVQASIDGEHVTMTAILPSGEA